MNILHFVQAHPGYAALASVPTTALLAMLVKLGWQAFDVLCEWVFPREDLNDDFTIEVILKFLQKNARQIGIRTSMWDATRTYVKSKERARTVFIRYGQYSNGFYIYRGAPIILNRYQELKDRKVKTHVRFIRGTINWRQMMTDAALYWDSLREETGRTKNFQIVRFTGSMTKDSVGSMDPSNSPPGTSVKKEETAVSGSTCWMDDTANDVIGYTRSDFVDDDWEEPDPFGTLALSKAMRKCVRDAKFWFSKRKWYLEKQIPWRRGYLLFGQPGVGKTSLVRALAQYLDIPIHIFDLSSMNNFELTTAWKQSRGAGIRLVLFEDFDNVFHGRTNMVPGSKLTFDVLLNLLDGIERENGLLFIVTANHPEHIDEAMGKILPNGRSTRPGRIDKSFGLPNLSEAGRIKIALRIIDDPEVAQMLADEGREDSGAQFTDRCVSYALDVLWKGEAPVEDDDEPLEPVQSEDRKPHIKRRMSDEAKRISDVFNSLEKTES